MHKRGDFVNISIKLEGIEMLAAKLNSIAGGSALQNGLLQGGEIVPPKGGDMVEYIALIVIFTFYIVLLIKK